MSSSRKLSTDEVDALMEGLQSGVISTEGNISPEAEVRPFVFGSDDLSLLGDYYALRLINERSSEPKTNGRTSASGLMFPSVEITPDCNPAMSASTSSVDSFLEEDI